MVISHEMLAIDGQSAHGGSAVIRFYATMVSTARFRTYGEHTQSAVFPDIVEIHIDGHGRF